MFLIWCGVQDEPIRWIQLAILINNQLDACTVKGRSLEVNPAKLPCFHHPSIPLPIEYHREREQDALAVGEVHFTRQKASRRRLAFMQLALTIFQMRR